YHTSALTGEAWVRELLNGHPNHIKTEPGACLHIFCALIEALIDCGLGPSKHISLKE
ncbi:hypothetical protein JAAARDRAFT_113051, partial [Jaapia argillacea MUCL 33604]